MSECIKGEVLQRLNSIEESLNTRLELIEEKLKLAHVGFQVVHDGLEAYKSRLLKEKFADSIHRELLARIRNDKELRFPHRKIFEFLINQYDFATRKFKEIHFSQLVKESHIGKNKAKDYLSLLEEKGFVESRSDGYRLFFKIRGKKI